MGQVAFSVIYLAFVLNPDLGKGKVSPAVKYEMTVCGGVMWINLMKAFHIPGEVSEIQRSHSLLSLIHCAYYGTSQNPGR